MGIKLSKLANRLMVVCVALQCLNPMLAHAGVPTIHPKDRHRLAIDGEVFYPVGYYGSISSMNSDLNDRETYYKTFIDQLSDNRINYFRTVLNMGQQFGNVLTPYQRTGPGLANDGLPKFDLTKFDAKFFAHYKKIVDYANQKNIVVQISILDGWHNKFFDSEPPDPTQPKRAWGMKYDFYYGANNINGLNTANHSDWMSLSGPAMAWHKAFIRKVIRELGDRPNIIWEIANESNSIPWEEVLADHLTYYEKSLGFSPHLVMPRDLPSHQYVYPIKRAHCMEMATTVHKYLVQYFYQNVPLILNNDCKPYPISVINRRKKGWSALVSGGQVNYFHLSIRSLEGKQGLLSEDAKKGMKYLGYINKFLKTQKVDLVDMKPSDAYATNGWVYARPGEEYIIYLINGGSTTLSQLPAKYKSIWFNPRTGKASKAVGGPTFTAPSKSDWTLYIKEQ